MAVNPNFTNANPATPYYASGGGSGSNFPNGVTISGTQVKGNLTAQQPLGALGIGDPAVLTAPLIVNSLYFGEQIYGVGAYQASVWQSQGLNTTGSQTGVLYSNVIQFNSQVGANQNDTITMNRVSTIATAIGTSNINYTIDMVGLASTLKSVYPSIVS